MAGHLSKNLANIQNVSEYNEDDNNTYNDYDDGDTYDDSQYDDNYEVDEDEYTHDPYTNENENPWSKEFDPSTGHYYYFNYITNESVWEKPDEYIENDLDEVSVGGF